MYGCMDGWMDADLWMDGWISELHPAYFFIILEFRLPSPAAESRSSDSSPDRWKSGSVARIGFLNGFSKGSYWVVYGFYKASLYRF